MDWIKLPLENAIKFEFEMCQASQQDKFIKLNDSVYLKYARHSTRILKLIRDSTTMEKKKPIQHIMFAVQAFDVVQCHVKPIKISLQQYREQFSNFAKFNRIFMLFTSLETVLSLFLTSNIVGIIGSAFKVSAVMRRNLIAKMYGKKSTPVKWKRDRILWARYFYVI